MLLVLPGMHTGQGKATPPDFILKSDGPGGLLAGPSNQSVTSRFFFNRYCGSGLVIQCLARFQLVFSRLVPCARFRWKRETL